MALGEADSVQVSRYYAEALAFAADFNPAELEKRLNYLAGLLRSIAQDGDLTGATTICESVIFLWETAGLEVQVPLVPEFLANLRSELGG